MKLKLAAGAVALTAAALAGCGTVHAGRPAQTCQQQVDTWKKAGGIRVIDAVGGDFGKISRAIPAATGLMQAGDTSGFTAVARDATQLSADAHAALASPPPSCRVDRSLYRTAMSQAAESGSQLNAAATQIQAGNYGAADSSVRAGLTAITRATAAMGRMNAKLRLCLRGRCVNTRGRWARAGAARPG